MWNVGPPAVPASLTARFRLDPEWILLVIVLAGLILLGAFVIAQFKRWHRAQQATTPTTELEEYRALMEQGLLDPREFERIRDLLEKKSDSFPQPATPEPIVQQPADPLTPPPSSPCGEKGEEPPPDKG